MFVAGLMGWPSPLLAVQILWINLVTDGLPALALAMEPPDRDIMQRPPRPPGQRVVTLRQGLLMVAHGALLTVGSTIGFAMAYQNDEANLPAARTTAFCIVALGQLSYSFACRSQTRTLPELGFATNPYLFAAIGVSVLLQMGVVLLPPLRPIFETTGTLGLDWLLVIVLSLAPVSVIELVKLARAFGRRRSG
jgi:Ca2+-transporting ATPase